MKELGLGLRAPTFQPVPVSPAACRHGVSPAFPSRFLLAPVLTSFSCRFLREGPKL